MTHYAAAGFPVGDDVASLVIGVIGAFVSLALLFMIKPRLRLRLLRDSPEQGLEELDPSTGWRSVAKTGPAERMTTSSKSAGYSIQVENLGLGSAVELEARLWLISTDADKLDTRTNIDLKVEKLLELSGKWHEARRTPDDIRLRAGNSQFRFELPRGDDFTVPLGQLTVPSRQIIVRSGQVDVGPQPFVISAPQPAVGPEQLVNDRRYLFQVWSKHGFTNFGRVHKLRIACGDNGQFKYADDARDAARRPRFEYLIQLVTRLFASKEIREKRREGKDTQHRSQ
jgi:hypothetical protein